MVTASEAQAAIGVPVAATQPSDDGFDNVCTYTSADGQHWLSVSVHVGGIDRASFDRGKEDRDQWVPVAGVGTDAYFSADADTLVIWQSNSTIGIQIEDQSGNTTPDQIQAAEVKVATTAVGRL